MDPQTSVAVALLLLLAYGTGVEARARHKVGLGFGVVVGLLLLAACTFYEASQVSELLPSQVCHPSRSPLVRVLVFVWSTSTRLPLDAAYVDALCAWCGRGLSEAPWHLICAGVRAAVPAVRGRRSSTAIAHQPTHPTRATSPVPHHNHAGVCGALAF